MPALTTVTAVTISGAFAFGVILVLLSNIRSILAKRLDVSDARADWLLSAFHLSLIPMMLLGGMLIDAWGVKRVFIAGAVLTSLAVYLLALCETYWRAILAVLLLGAGGACVSAGSSVLMLYAFFPHNETASQNLGNVFFAMGALVTPMLADRAFERLGYRRALTALAMLCLLPALLAAFTSRDAFAPILNRRELSDVLFHPLVWLCGLVFLLYGPLENSLGTWARAYLADIGFRPATAGWLLSCYWLSFLAARFAAALVFEKRWLPPAGAEAWLIVCLALAAAVALGNMLSARTHPQAVLGFLLVGACFGPIFPTLVGILLKAFPEERGTAYGAMFAIGAGGSSLLLPLVGAVARRDTVQRAMRVPLITSLLLAITAIVLAFARFQKS